MYWAPPEMWKGQTAYIVGGGSSLRAFDFSPIYGQNVIGCNDAYLLGSWVNICYFGDREWYDVHSARPEFHAFTGLKIACTPFPIFGVASLERDLVDTLYLEGTKIGWFCNTGASAVNLAIRLGATKIILLGFDMHLGSKGESNWHPNMINNPNNEVYTNFMAQFKYLASMIVRLCPNVKVINANPYSSLECFPKMTLQEAMQS